jgi:hypothetical protein
MIFVGLTLDEILKIMQIIFYTTGSVVAILTYISAKKGLLNTINTEYQKRVMDRLKELSDELASEFNPDSPNYWATAQSTITIEAVKGINEAFLRDKEEIQKRQGIVMARIVGKDEQRLERIVQNIKTDPFLPRSIRNIVVDFLEKRMKALSNAYSSVLNEYRDDLMKGKYTETMDNNGSMVWGKLLGRLNESGYGAAHIENEVDNMRLAIQEYFNSYDPLPKRRSK